MAHTGLKLYILKAAPRSTVAMTQFHFLGAPCSAVRVPFPFFLDELWTSCFVPLPVQSVAP